MLDVLKYFPGLVNWKNIHSEFLGATTGVANLANLSSPEEMIGKSDEDMPWGKEGFAELFRSQDKETLQGKILHILSKTIYCGKERIFLVKKIPILRTTARIEQVVGTLNHLHEFCKPTIRNIISGLMDAGVEVTMDLLNHIKSTFLNQTHLLSPREELCAYYLLKGLTSKEIARKLNISFRTVESYINGIKLKLDCKKTAGLIVKLLDLGYNQLPLELINKINHQSNSFVTNRNFTHSIYTDSL